MTKKIALFVFTAILVASLASLIFAQGTTLTAAKVAAGPTLDGATTDAAWSAATALTVPVAGGKIGNVDVALKAVYDDSNIYMLLQWADSTLSIDKNLWEYDGSSWSKSGNEDRFAILWGPGGGRFHRARLPGAVSRGWNANQRRWRVRRRVALESGPL